MLKIKKTIPMFNVCYKDMVEYLEQQADSGIVSDGTDFIKKLSK